MKAERAARGGAVLGPAGLGPTVMGSEILIGACLARGAAFEALRRVLDRGRLIFSDATFLDLAELLLAPELDRLLGARLDLARRAEILADMEAAADWTAPGPSPRVFPRPVQDKLFATAVAAEADWLVTGEAELLALEPGFQESRETLRILTPEGFLDALSD